MERKTQLALKRAVDHCRWEYRGRPKLLKSCIDGAHAGIDGLLAIDNVRSTLIRNGFDVR